MHSLNYAILRLIPNARRQEIINIGVAVFHEGGFNLKLLKSYGKIKALCPAYQLDLFPALEDDLRFIAGSDADYGQVCKSLRSLGGLSLGPLASFNFAGEKDFSKAVEELMRIYVYPETNVPDHQSPTLFHLLRKELSKITSLSSNSANLDDFQLIEWYSVDSQGWMKSEFAYKSDARIVFIQALDLRVSDRRELFRTISSRKMIGETIKDVFGKEAEIIVAYRVSDDARNVGGEHLLTLVKGYADVLYDFDSAHEIGNLTSRVAWSQGPNRSLELVH